MDIRTKLLTTLITIVFAACAFAQEAPRIEDVFRWFPQGTYAMIKYSDYESLEKGAAFPLYKEFFLPVDVSEEPRDDGKKSAQARHSDAVMMFDDVLAAARSQLRSDLPLPELFRDNVRTATVGHVMVLHDTPQQMENNVNVIQVDVREKDGEDQAFVGAFIQHNSMIGVFEIADPQALMKSAIEKNLVTRTGKKLAGHSIFVLQQSEEGHRNPDAYMTIAPTGELLFAYDRKNLRKMLLTGQDKIPNLLDDVFYVDLINLATELGQKWLITSHRKSNEQLLSSAQINIVDQEILDKMLEQNKDRPLVTISTITVADELIAETLSIYENDEGAEKSKGKSSAMEIAGEKKAWNRYQQLLSERKSTVVDDNILKTTLKVDRKLLEAEADANTELQDNMLSNGGMITIHGKNGKELKFKSEKGSKESTTITIEKKDK